MPAIRSPLRPAIRSALRSPLDPAISSGGAFSPLSLFTGGELGLWFDPSDMATLYQDSAGTTPVTAVTQPDGLVLDKRLGLVRGAELVTAGAGPTSTASWAAAGATQSIVSGELEIINTSAGVGRSDGSFTCVAGKLYELVGVVRSGAANAVAQSARVVLTINGVGLTQVIVDTNGVAKPFAFKFFAASATTPTISIQVASAGAAGALGDKAYLSGCSIKEIPGNHALQATSAARPIYNSSGGAKYLTFDGVDDALATGAITLGADMDCFIAVRRNSAAAMILFTAVPGIGAFLGVIQDGNSGAASDTAGTPTFAVNGTDVPGGTSTTRGQLAAAIPVSTWVVLEVRNLNLSIWPQFCTSTYPSFEFNGDIGGIILAPAQSTASRNQIRTYLGAKVGLVL